MNDPLYSLKASDGSILYGCSTNVSNPYQLSWNSNGNQTTKLNSFLSDILTCNSNNSSATADMMLFICFDDYCTININGKTTNQGGLSTNSQGIYYSKIKYGDSVKISGINVCGLGGLALSYIWNKQLFILDNNGFQNSANIIDYVVTGATGWDSTTWINYTPTISPWMKNFITCQNCNTCDGSCQTTLTLEFKVGYTKKSQLNSDVNMFLGIDDQGIVYKNGIQVYNKNQTFGQTVNFVIPNVNENDTIDIQCTNLGGPGGVGVLFLWSGAIYSFPQFNIDGFNSSVNLINLTLSTNNTVNTYNYTYHQNGPGVGYFNLMPTWLYTNDVVCNFNIQFKLRSSHLIFKLSSGYSSIPNIDDTKQVSIINTNNVTMVNDPIRGSVFYFNGQNYLKVNVITGINFTRSVWAYYVKPCDPFYNNNNSVTSNKCLRETWTHAGCTTADTIIPDSYNGWWNQQSLTTDQNDMYKWATMTDDEHRSTCYGNDKTKWPPAGNTSPAPITTSQPGSCNIYSSVNCPLWYPGSGYNINASINFQNKGPYIKDNANRINTWAHYVTTYDSSTKTFSLYVNGVFISNTVLDSSNLWIGDIGSHWIGGYQGSNNWYGYISDIQEYDIAMTPSQINQLYNSQKK